MSRFAARDGRTAELVVSGSNTPHLDGAVVGGFDPMGFLRALALSSVEQADSEPRRRDQNIQQRCHHLDDCTLCEVGEEVG